MFWPGLLASYLIGSIPFGLIVGRAKGVDLRKEGSGNIGATNVGRVLGAKWGLVVFLLDFLKGAVPAWAGLTNPSEQTRDITGILYGLAAFTGHLFPLFLGFKGGKGVATGAGAVAVLMPIPFTLAIFTWLSLVAGWRMVSLGSLAATMILSLVQSGLYWKSGSEGSLALAGFAILATALVWIKHIGNLKRILAGTESKVKESCLWETMERLMVITPLALWLGGGLFFTFVIGPGVFSWFEALSLSPDRPYWLPLPGEFTQPAPAALPGPLAREQASRLAGVVVNKIFPLYYFGQVFLGFLVLLVLMGQAKRHPGCRCPGWILRLVASAWLLALMGWAMEIKVRQAYRARTVLVDELLREKPPTPGLEEKVRAARRAFGISHGISLLLNFGAIGLLSAGFGLAVVWRPKPHEAGGAAGENPGS